MSRPLVGLASLALMALVGPAHADDQSVALQLFEEARGLVAKQDWPNACPKFEASLRYVRTLGTMLNLADCYVHTNKTASAWTLYREAIDVATNAGDLKRQTFAKKQRDLLATKLARIAITVTAPIDGLVITNDGVEVDRQLLGGMIVDAGEHHIEASAPGYKTWTGSALAKDAETTQVNIPALEPSPVDPSPTQTPIITPVSPRTRAPVEVAPMDNGSRKARVIGVSLGAAGLVATGVGLTFGILARGYRDDAKDVCPELACADEDRLASAKDSMSKARNRAALSTGFVIGGVAAVGAGITIYVLSRPSTTHVVPTASDGSIGLSFGGSF